MTTSVLICDDSNFARKQIARSLPDDWDVQINFAENGQVAIDLIKEGKADVMFLDLNMPVMDGYQTMEIIKRDDLPTMVIVVSGDVQPEAKTRMLAMGAVDFIRKPIDNAKLLEILRSYGLYEGDGSNKTRASAVDTAPVTQADQLDIFREMANIAMGQAGESLARLLDEFIELPIPNVNLIDPNELHMAIDEIEREDSVSAVSKGFVGSGIRGEALVIFSDTDSAAMVNLLKYHKSDNPEQLELEALMDVSNILIGACLKALSDQLNVSFNHYHPIVLGRHQELKQLLTRKDSRWDKVLGIEIAYSIQSQSINFDLLLLIPGKSIAAMNDRLINAARASLL